MQNLPPYPVVLFDGPCGLCQKSVQFLMRHENGTELRFASIQSEKGQELLKNMHLPLTPDEMVLVVNGEAFSGADAAFELCRYLTYPARILGIFRVLPKALTHRVYRWVARHRYQWFGKAEECLLPEPDQSARFLDEVKVS